MNRASTRGSFCIMISQSFALEVLQVGTEIKEYRVYREQGALVIASGSLVPNGNLWLTHSDITSVLKRKSLNLSNVI